LENPIDSSFIVDLLRSNHEFLAAHHSLAITGGEPLLHPQFVAELARGAHGLGLKVYLETNGQRVEELGQVIGVIDIVAMDAKLPSNQEQSRHFNASEFILRTTEFLRLAQKRDVFVKIVCDTDTADEEIETVARALANEKPDLTLVLQPVTPRYRGQGALGPARLLRLQERTARYIRDVRIIPQCHRLLGVK